MRTHFKYHQDPGHGWVEVTRAELVELGISSKITPYSYQSQDGETCFLEEDMDLNTLCDAMRDKHVIKPTWDEIHTDNEHWIRFLNSFKHRVEPVLYRVIIGNIGTTYDGPRLKTALEHYEEYVRQSKSGFGRAGHEPVTLMEGDEIKWEHTPLPDTFKVWATIERVREVDGDEETEDMNEIPAMIGRFDTLAEAEAFVVTMDKDFVADNVEVGS